MKENNSITYVPFIKKGDFKKVMKRYVRRRMWYIGRIYRASKGQQFHNKFIKRFLQPHYLYNRKFYVFNKYLYFTKNTINRNFLWPNLNFFGNIEKFYSGYKISNFDGNFQFISKRLLKKLKSRTFNNIPPMFFVNGCTFIGVSPNRNFEIPEMEEELFFPKNSLIGGFINSNDEVVDFPFNFNTDLELYHSFEIYRVLSIGILNSLCKDKS